MSDYLETDDGRRFWLGELLSVQGNEDCEDPRCTRMGFADGTTRCLGYHCPKCGEPCSMMGHSACRGES